MFFKAIVFLKLFLLRRKLTKGHAKDIPRPSVSDKTLKPLAVLLDLDTCDPEVVAAKLAMVFKVPVSAVVVLGFSRSEGLYRIPNFALNKQLTWFNGVNSEEIEAFISNSYTYFVNFYETKNPVVNLISLRTKALLRIGFQGQIVNSLDFILETPICNERLLYKNLADYLNKISL